MKYANLLLGYKSLPIAFIDVPYLLKDGYDSPSALNPALFLLFNNNTIFKGCSLPKNITLRPDEMVLNLNPIKRKLFSYFNIPNPDDAITILNGLEEDIKNGVITTPDISLPMQEAFDHYRLRRHMDIKAKPNKINKAKRKEFLFKTRMDIRAFRNLLVNENTYSKIANVFDISKLQLYLAYKVMNHALICESNYDLEGFQFAIAYLQTFLNENPQLIDQNFTLLFSKTNHKTGKNQVIKEIKISDIVAFIHKKTHEETSNPLEIYNYSFFEPEGQEIKHIFRDFYQTCTNPENSEELQEKLFRKIKLYESLNPIALKIGIDSFDGYIGFVLANGYVILDKLYENRKNGKIATNNAIYITSLADFENVTKMSKTATIAAIATGKIQVRRIVHEGNYEEKVKTYLTRKKPTNN